MYQTPGKQYPHKEPTHTRAGKKAQDPTLQHHLLKMYEGTFKAEEVTSELDSKDLQTFKENFLPIQSQLHDLEEQPELGPDTTVQSPTTS